MRNRIGRLALLLALGLALIPTAARGQGMPPPHPELPLPLIGPWMEDGGFYVAAEFLFLQQSNPLEKQVVAERGIIDTIGLISGTPGAFLGSKDTALSTDDVSGPVTFQPGVALTAGWRFRDGVVIELNWWHLTDARYSATASLLPRDFDIGPTFLDSFLTSPVFNFPIDYAGPANILDNNGNPDPGATFGIWNASSLQTIDFVQRFDMGTVNLRIPIEQNECYRTYGLVGGRAVIMWERFKWRTVDNDFNGVATAIDFATYTNVVSNRIYGANIGYGWDWYLGSGPLGALSVTAEVQGMLGIDIVKERAKYELGNLSTAASRAINEYTLAPVVQGNVAIMWYPTQGIQARIGYNILAAFNTVAAPHPIDFNFGALAPAWETGETRVFNGLNIGVAFIF